MADLLGADKGRKLLECSREERIAALKLFPQLVMDMKAKADDGIKAIDAAKKFVK